MLRLRPYKKCDAKEIISWIRDEKSFHKWSAGLYGKYPITEDDMNHMYEEMAYSDAFYPMTAFDETGVIGHLVLRFLDDEKKELRFGFIIVNDQRRGNGYGRKMLLLALKYAFEILKVERVTLVVFDSNPQAFACYRSVGFRESNTECSSYNVLGEHWRGIEMEIKNEM